MPGFNAPRRRLLAAAGAGLAVAAFGRAARADTTTLRIGVTAGPHAQILEAVRNVAARRGLALKIVEFSDYITPNVALDAGDLQANSYQHRPFLDQQIKDRGYRIEAVGETVTFPLGIYSRRWKRWQDVPTGARVAIQNDPTNGGRSLLLLQEAGVIRLREGVGLLPTLRDVADNPHKLRFVEIEAAQAPRVLDDVDAAAVNTNFALPAGLNPGRDALLLENPKGPYVNLIAVRGVDRDKPWVRTLVESYRSDEVKAFILAKFDGAVLASW
ncbi:L-methionine/D-methionine ABC transporter membrane anchored binding protein [Rhodovastum atsumiense]|uniref:Lipoprotein n=1 Tax=Rhodovastum atsumiense TaxID=504468 RepID=A0A5M6IUD4_9PROT|nr:MetQ/NlpA family ABC transporter substrate-binding protein [Rhodovastum atsumiense]KAA5611477.1 MetQ/NlpA family ABC transporter substrate-binding protein [Rhodovastum atsumiense]CAH2601168.1 L-methionine/D-methionine ABC transporter membrane anchored binding protein [Rhodovastum atsumiense]